MTLAALGSTWGRGTGVVDLARAAAAGVPERASGALASHPLDVMLAIRDAAGSGHAVAIDSSVVPTPPLAADWDPSVPTRV